jgi:hypothetical protein
VRDTDKLRIIFIKKESLNIKSKLFNILIHRGAVDEDVKKFEGKYRVRLREQLNSF